MRRRYWRGSSSGSCTASPHEPGGTSTGEWLEASSRSDDTLLIAYGNASILEAADLGASYPHLWTLPMRTLDPELERLRATLAGSGAPTWILQTSSFNSWGMDGNHRVRKLIADRYRVVGRVCGHQIWLLDDEVRTLAAPPRC